MPTSNFTNPYAGQENLHRLTTMVSDADYSLIKLIRVQTATLATTQNLLWFKLCQQLREYGITDISKCSQFEDFITNCRIISADEYDKLVFAAAQWEQHQASHGRLSDSTTRRVVAKGAKRIQRSRASAVPGGEQPTPQQPTDTPQSHGSTGTTGGGVGGQQTA